MLNSRQLLIWFASSLICAALSMPAASADDAGNNSTAKPQFTAKQLAFFDQKVKPLLEARCFKCHSSKVKKPKGGLRLDTRAFVLKGGDSGPAVVPGKPEKSLLVEAINYRTFEMPPRTKLPAGEIAILTEWVKIGLPYSKGSAKPIVAKKELFPLEERKKSHWAWRPIRKPELPAVKDRKWAATPIDRFILARLEAKGLSPAPQADRRTLIRRAYFDLIGLPPSPKEVAEFVNDPAPTPKAFATVVDRLLKSPHFGERWARHWLDLVRYAETLGHEYDYPLRHAHQYRDYVIRAFNADVPYNQFVTEHIAGDLLDKPRRHPTQGYNESIIGTGFWFLGEDKHSPVDVKAEEASKIDNQLDVFSKTFLGLTVACARCHDHKFDAISTRDYYALSGFLQSSRRNTALLDPGGEIRSRAAELKSLQEKGTQLLRAGLPKPSEKLSAEIARYLMASCEVLAGIPKTRDRKETKTAAKPDVVFEDFEKAGYPGWKLSGRAFGKVPARGTLPRQQRVSGFLGKGLVNTYRGGDGSTGTLTSKEFTIDRRAIRFLIGGGAHVGQTCMNLVVDRKIVRTATGKNNERLEPAAWDVSDLRGKRAVLLIVDSARGGWGHINVDQIVFSDSLKGAVVRGTKRPVPVVAKEFGVDAERLRRLVSLLQSPQINEASHPLWVWKQFVTATSADFAMRKSAVSRRAADFRSEHRTTSAKSKLFARLDAAEANKWFVDGYAFDPMPTPPGQWDARNGGILTPGVMDSGRHGDRLAGFLRSPTFKITHDTVLLRVKGQGRIRVIIDGYVMDEFNGLIFRGLILNANTNGRWQWLRIAGDMKNYKGRTAYIEVRDAGAGSIAVQEVRFANGGDPPPAERPSNVAESVLANRSVRDRKSLADRYGELIAASLNRQAEEKPDMQLLNVALQSGLLTAGRNGGELNRLATQFRKIDASIPEPMRTIAMTDGTEENEHVFIRGSHKNLGPVAPRRMLAAISGDQREIRQGSGRLELAKRLLDPANPFPARVMVNRLWHHLTGRGIVASVDNFGVLGQRPTHPELLDYLAHEFREDGWSVKRAIRRIMLSNSYMMSSTPEEAGPRALAEKVDPQNLLLHRMRIRRLQGEAIRDAMLAVSGRLDRTLFGEPVPIYLTRFMQGRGRPRRSGPLDGDGRRSIYISVRRNFLSPMMLAFDTPIPFTAIGRRNVSNVPAQALILLNDPFVVQQAELWTKRVLAESRGTPEERIRTMYVTAFARQATSEEVKNGVSFLKSQAAARGVEGDGWKTHPETWNDLGHVLFNVKEFIYLK